ncbi:unnamed protein product [Rhizophagus irregularis]|nr:unnamed protein product [Rhizophagus irregularis]CAB4431747.1 unnamed protein product [Rhizophagus irregularis]
MADNSNNKSNNNNTTESIPNIALLLQLLTNPAALQKAASSIIQNHQQISSVPSFTPSTISNTLVGIVDTSSPRGSIQNPITKEEWNQWKKRKQPKEDWKDFLNLSYDTYWTYRRNIRDRLNATCEKGKYVSEQIPGKVQSVINSFKSDFPTFPISVGDFVLQKMIEDIVGNWADTERRKKIKEARTQGITPPPKRKNISPPKSKTKKLMLSTPLSDCIETEINDTEVQLPLPENPAICDVQQMLKDSDDAHVQQIPEESDEVQIQQTPEDPDEAQIQQTSENPAIRTSKVQKEPKNSGI